MVIYGQVIVGPPGSGKTTYCNGMQQYLRLIGRETVVINLDSANEYHPPSSSDDDNDNDNDNDNDTKEPQSHLPYDALLDASEEIINLSTVMEELNLGPNGGLIYCLEYIHHHIETFQSILQSKLQAYQTQHNLSQPPYLLFDLPGQVELYTHSTTVQSILNTLIKSMDMRLVMVQLIDAHNCMDVYKFISSALLSTTTMLRLELPAVNVLSKVDLLSTFYSINPDGDGDNDGDDGHYNGMPFNLDFFMECQELDRLLPFLEQQISSSSAASNHDFRQEEILENDEEYQEARRKTMQNRFYKRHSKLHYELCDVINDFSLLSFIPLNINDAESVGRVVARIDKCNGYVFVKGRGNTSTGSASASTSSNNNNTAQKQTASAEDMFQCAMQVDSEWGYEQIVDVQKQYMNLYQDEPELVKNPKKNNR